MRSIVAFFPVLLALASCATFPRGGFQPSDIPPAPDYADPAAWAALPDRPDNADRTPDPSLRDNQSASAIDVFFLHPTTYIGRLHGRPDWNAPVADARLNKITDEGTILFQASIFNGAGRVFAPRFRQAHIRVFFTKDTLTARQALDLAYADVKAAFQYYLDHYNQGRPIIIAGHSQGALHARHLLEDLFDGHPLQEKLVAAYLVGWPVLKNQFRQIPPCTAPDQTGCFCSWRTFKTGYLPPRHFPLGDSITVTNPLSWTTDETYAPDTLNLGAVIRPFDNIRPKATDALKHSGILWARKPRFPGSILFTRRNYHIGDLNLYYVNVRENAISRGQAFLRK